MDKSIRVRIMGRDIPLIVREEHELLTREIAAYVDAKMQSFKKAHAEQPELTTAIVAALVLGEELYAAREERDRLQERVDEALESLERRLAAALNGPEAPDAGAPN